MACCIRSPAPDCSLNQYTEQIVVVVVVVVVVVRVQKNLFFKKAQTSGFLGFGLYWVFQIFYLNDHLGSLLVHLAHQLSFYLDSSVLSII